MKKAIIAIVALVVLGVGYWFFTKPIGTTCDCSVQSYYEKYRDYCMNLSKDELGPTSFEEIQSNMDAKMNCGIDFKSEYNEEGGYVKYDAIMWYDDSGLPFWRPVVLKDDGKYPTNDNVEQIKKALETQQPTEINR